MDYTPLDALESHRLRTINPIVVADQEHQLRGKVVLLGDATRGKATDTFVVPGKPEVVPGVYLHACAAYTLANPLYEMTGIGRIAIDATLSLTILFLVTCIRLNYNGSVETLATSRLQSILTLLVSLTAIVFGVIFVRATRVMWDDFILVIAAVVFHAKVHHCVLRAWLLIREKAPLIRDAILFDRTSERQR